jgi:hypothetical protein
MAASLEQEGVVFIVLPDRVGAGDDAEWVEERRLTTFSPRRAALALAVAGCFCLGAAWQLLAAGWGGRGASPSSFLLPLHAKSQNWTAAGVQAFQDRCVQLVQQFHRPLVFCNQAVVSWSFGGGNKPKLGQVCIPGGLLVLDLVVYINLPTFSVALPDKTNFSHGPCPLQADTHSSV